MNPTIRRLGFVLAMPILLGGMSPLALAGVPNAGTSILPRCFVPCPFGDIGFPMIIKDAAGNPNPNSVVVLNFANCPELTVCSEQEAGTSFNPFAHTFARATDFSGAVDFHLRLGGSCSAATPLTVTADGVPMHRPDSASQNWPIQALDQDGDLLVTANDHTLMEARIAANDATADLNCDQLLDANDLAVLDAHMNHVCPATTPTLPKSWGSVKVIYR